MKVLYVDAAVRSESRTARLAGHLLEKLGGETERIRLSELSFPTADEAFLDWRGKACASGDFSDGIFAPAKQFASADVIVIAAPFWDLSFPASLKQFFEQINVIGLTFAYSAEGMPYSLCRAKTLYYVTTSGGKIFSEEYGFGYVKALAHYFYGIEDCRLVKAEGLDIVGADVEGILVNAEKEADALAEI